MGFPYRLSLDVGTASIGWAVLRLREDGDRFHPVAIVRGGVRIFPSGRDPRSGSSLAVERREARSARRNRDRRSARKRNLVRALIDFGLFPADREERYALADLDPYELRRRGLDQPLTEFEFGRVIFHLNQRRGFKSNRKTDSADPDGSKMKSAISEVRERLKADGFRTVGEWLADRHDRGEGVKARREPAVRGPEDYTLFVDRQMIEDEFDALWEAQEELSGGVGSDGAREVLRGIIFTQRPLKAVPKGRCTLEPTKERAAKALPSVQRLRVVQEVNNLKVRSNVYEERGLTLEEKQVAVRELIANKSRTFRQLRKAMQIDLAETFNLETAKRTRLDGDSTASLLSQDEFFGADWSNLTLERQDEIVLKLISEEDDSAVIEWLVSEYAVSEDLAGQIAALPLPPGYSSFCLDVTRKLLPPMEAEIIPISEAVVQAGYRSHSDLQASRETGELLFEMPYYGEALQRHVRFETGNEVDGNEDDPPEKRFGKIANPTVHIGLNEIRKIVNELIGEYGTPTQTVIEVTRDLKHSAKVKDEIEKAQKAQQDRNEAYKQQLKPVIGSSPSSEDLRKMRLWEELSESPIDRRCPFTGEQISLERLFRPGSDIEIEHILPLSRSLDDSLANKTLAVRQANRDKGDQTPYEAFGHSPGQYNYAEILERSANLPKKKSYRFAENAMERFVRDDKDFVARALNDTAYLSRLAREYMSTVTPWTNVWVVPGQLTGLLRRQLGLNGLLGRDGEKNRDDHRHHAVDAAVIGIMDRGFLQSVARATGKGRDPNTGIEKLVSGPPWPSYRESVERMVNHIHVSHKPNHSHEAGMANDTIYGLRPDGEVTVRKPLSAFDSAAMIDRTNFADRTLKKRLLTAIKGAETPAEIRHAIADFSTETGIRRVHVNETLEVIKLFNNDEAPERAPRPSRSDDGAYAGRKGDSNYCIEIYADEKGRWRSEVITTFAAYQIVRASDGSTAQLRNPQLTQSGKPLIMRLTKNDTVRIVIDSVPLDYRVCKFGHNGQLSLAPTNESNVDSRNRDSEDDFKYLSKAAGPLKDLQARNVTVSPAGRLRDPGPTATS